MAEVLHALLYVSKSMLAVPEEVGQVRDIITISHARNPGLGITGALVFTQLHFAQLLEGPAGSLERLMASIRADPRHRDIEIVFDEPADERRFGSWSMAWCGSSFFFSQLIQPLSGRDPNAKLGVEAGRLIRAMQQYAG